VDFGLAVPWAAAHSRESLEWSGGISGTVAYMAPEQIRGELVDARADLYSLGCIVYELLTGRKPFPGRSFSEVAAAHLSRAPEPLSRLVPSLPAELDALVPRLMRKDPRERLGYADVPAKPTKFFTTVVRSTSAPTGISSNAHTTVPSSSTQPGPHET
jgi:serine/threonine protein kinase